MNWKIKTIGEHFGAELHEIWEFPKPRDMVGLSQEELVVELRICDGHNERSPVISSSTIPLSEAPVRAKEAYLEEAKTYRDCINKAIDELEDE